MIRRMLSCVRLVLRWRRLAYPIHSQPDAGILRRQWRSDLLSNDDWRSTQEQEIRATIPPTNDLESAIVATLPPGYYTALVHDGAAFRPASG